MPNIKRHEVDARRAHMKSLIRSNPRMSGDKLNDLFFKKFGSKVRINTIYDLKEELGYDRNGNKKGGRPITTARRDPQAPMTIFPMMVRLEGEDPVALVERVIKLLREAEVVNLQVSRGPDWLVLEPIQ